MRLVQLLLAMCIFLLADTQELETRLATAQQNLNASSNIWLERLKKHENYGNVIAKIQKIQQELKILQTKGNASQINTLNHTMQDLRQQEKRLEPYKSDPFKDLVQKPPVPKFLASLFLVLGGGSFDSLKVNLETMREHQQSLTQALAVLERELEALNQLKNTSSDRNFSQQISQKEDNKTQLQSAQKLLEKNIGIYVEEMKESKNNVVLDLALTPLLWLVVLGALSIFWYSRKKAMNKGKPTYKINRWYLILHRFVFLAYIVTSVYCLICILRLAGVSISHKMVSIGLNSISSYAILRWIAIKVILSDVREGDRVKVSKDGNTYVGDVIEISSFYLTLFENVTLDTCLRHDGRAGRVIFVPTSYVLTGLFVKYNHLSYLGIRMVWDGVEFLIAFNSNLQSAEDIAKKIATQHSEKYSKAMHEGLNERKKYSSFNLKYIELGDIKKTCPRVFFMPKKEGMCLYVFYVTDPHEALESRSRISVAIVEAFRASGNIFMIDVSKTRD
ncbi:mechanosensitive ion channel domain-containing protein [Helicobacter sp. L8]|uniref:mechanosensitive ion channel domain-containing protein n=1 Tax=Helicobacter sp. L8 TaxID=2316078 RepID=UPI000EAD79B0|nr:mechanosensitive ion channel domain-containing protein [Helicobacter sp. L8]